MNQGLIKNEEAVSYLLGGNCIATIKNIVTEKRFTYKIKLKSSFGVESFEVKLLYGSDNMSSYKVIGSINPETFKFTAKNNPNFIVQPPSPSSDMLKRVIVAFFIDDYDSIKDLEVWHNGKCCRCGRLLTVPESIKSGIGPECMKYQIIKNFSLW